MLRGGEEAAVGAQLRERVILKQSSRQTGSGAGVCLPRQGGRSRRWQSRATQGRVEPAPPTGLTQGPPPGLAYICEGLKEQRKGLVTLVLWNNQLTHTGMAFLGMTLVSPPEGPRRHLPRPCAQLCQPSSRWVLDGGFWTFPLLRPLQPFPEGVALHHHPLESSTIASTEPVHKVKPFG